MTAPHSPNADGRAEKRFPCRPVRGWTLGALVRAFGEFAPRADSGLRGAGQADADGGEPEPANRAKIAPGRAANESPRPNPSGAFYPPKPPAFDGLADAPRPPRTFPRRAAANVLQSAPSILPHNERQETPMKSPLRNSLAACAAALALVLLAALAQPAAAQEKKTKVERLLKVELDEFWSDDNGWTQLHWAALANDGETVRRLLELGAIANPRAKGDGSEFSGEGQRLAGLLGKDASGWKNYAETPLLVAAEFKSHVVASILIAKGAKVNASNSYTYFTPLHWAAIRNMVEIAKLLIDKGANVNAQSKNNKTPFNYANSKMQSLLRRHGGRAGAGPPPTKTKTEKFLREEGQWKWGGQLDVNARVSPEGYSAHNNLSHLHVAAWKNDMVAARWLIAKGAEVNAENNNGWTPLGYAAEENAAAVAKLLIDNGAEVNAKTEYGTTPLHVAAYHNAAEVAKLLIANGAEVNAKDEDGETPLDWAIEKEHSAMQSLLRRNGGRCNKKC